MPEFILDHGTRDAAITFAKLPSFQQGYIEAMFFTNASDPDDGDLEDATVADLAPSTLERIRRDCIRFQWKARKLLRQAYTRDYDETQAGRDFWFTRNGHGAGFWDRKELEDGELGDQLSDVCRYSEVDLYRGDDGLVYLD
jgi:hypothetical protein